MKKEEKNKIIKSVGKAVLEVIREFLNAPDSFNNERDIECYLYSQLSKNIHTRYKRPLKYEIVKRQHQYLSENTLLHAAAKAKKTKKASKKKYHPEKYKCSNGYFDIGIEDEKPDNLFLAIEIKRNCHLDSKSVRKDIHDMFLQKNNLKYGIMLNFDYRSLTGESKTKIKLCKDFNEKMCQDLKNFKNKKIKVFYYYVFIDYEREETRGIVLFKKQTKSNGFEYNCKLFNKLNGTIVHRSLSNAFHISEIRPDSKHDCELKVNNCKLKQINNHQKCHPTPTQN